MKFVDTWCEKLVIMRLTGIIARFQGCNDGFFADQDCFFAVATVPGFVGGDTLI